MKTTIIGLVAIAAFASPVLADDIQKTCENSGLLAERAMRNRQDEVPMSTQMKTLDGNDSAAAHIARLIITGAYEEQGWSSDEAKERAIKKFRNQIEVICFSHMGKK